MPKRNIPRRRRRRALAGMQALEVQRAESREDAERWLDAVARLEDQLDRYLLLFEEAPVGYLTLDEKGTVRDINATACTLLATRHDRVIAKPLLPLVYRPDARLFLQHLLRCHRAAPGVDVTTELRLRSGREPVHVRLLSRRGLLPGIARADYHTVVWNVSEERSRERALRHSEKLHRDIVETANEGICIVNDRNEIVFANPRLGIMLGTDAQDLIGRSAFELTPADDLESERRAFERREGGAELRTEQRLLRRDGSTLATTVSTVVLRDERGRFAGMIRMYTDATARDALLRARESLMRQLVAAQERERERIARELHDQLGQHVVALSLGLARVAASAGNDDTAALVEQQRRVADALGRDVHRLAIELRPAALDHLGLAVALTSYAEDVARRSGLEVDVHCDPLEDGAISKVAQTGLYRIAQEALTNVLKHAQARHVSIILERRSDGLQLIIEDDGVGLQTGQVPSSRLGLAGMRERAALLGGDLTIESSHGRGVTVYARIPLSDGTSYEHQQDTPSAPGR